MKRILKIIIPFLLAVPPLCAQDRVEALRADVQFFADSLQTGRACGTGGAQAAAFYLLRQLRDLGLRTTVQSFDAGGHAGHNVVAVTPGWYRSYIVVGAHFDGLGTLDGKCYPGADSNASGVAALLALARSLTGTAQGATGLIFVAFDGYNADMSGSRAFLEQFRTQYPIRMMVNLDILGSALAPVRLGRPDYLIALGGTPQRSALEAANRGPGLDLSYDYYGSAAFTDLFYRRVGDQRWFLEAGIPAIVFTSGITDHTNKVTDTPATLHYPLLSRRIDLIAIWLQSFL